MYSQNAFVEKLIYNFRQWLYGLCTLPSSVHGCLHNISTRAACIVIGHLTLETNLLKIRNKQKNSSDSVKC